MTENHILSSRITHAHRIQHEQDCAECGGTGSTPWEMDDLIEEVSHVMYHGKKHGRTYDIVAVMRLLLSLYKQGRECNTCEGTGVC